jgi:hypothetical protein
MLGCHIYLEEARCVSMTAETGKLSVDRIRQAARVFSFLIILITLLIALSHIFGEEPVVEDYPPIENLMPIILLLSVVGLAVSWRWEALGAVITLTFFLVHLVLFWVVRGYFFPFSALAVFLPIPITALMFLWSWWKTRSMA